MEQLTLFDSNTDHEARCALWKAICIAVDDLKYRYKIDFIGKRGDLIRTNSDLPNVKTWQLVEAISLLGIILRAGSARARLIKIFGKTDSIEIEEDGEIRHLWAQTNQKGNISQLFGRPDLVVTTSNDLPNSKNAIRIIEAKCQKYLGAQEIRSEFGKAFDLRVGSYLIWSFYSQNQSVIQGARSFGISIESLGFEYGAHQRKIFIEDPKTIISHVVNTQEQVRKECPLAKALIESGDDAKLKFLY